MMKRSPYFLSSGICQHYFQFYSTANENHCDGRKLKFLKPVDPPQQSPYQCHIDAALFSSTYPPLPYFVLSTYLVIFTLSFITMINIK